jgi:hypothetical protein
MEEKQRKKEAEKLRLQYEEQRDEQKLRGDLNIRPDNNINYQN